MRIWPTVPPIAPGGKAGDDREPKKPQFPAALAARIESETAGNPMSELKWQRSSLRKLSHELTKTEHPVSHTTVGRLLQEQHYTLKANENA
jgi:hypothetical protein